MNESYESESEWTPGNATSETDTSTEKRNLKRIRNNRRKRTSSLYKQKRVCTELRTDYPKIRNNEYLYDDEDYDDEEERNRELKKPASKSKMSRYNLDEINYYRSLTFEDKLKIDEIENNIDTINERNVPMRFKILQSNMNTSVKSIAIRKLEQIYSMEPSAAVKLSNYVENLIKLPIGKYKKCWNGALDTKLDKKPLEPAELSKIISKVQESMDESVYGHTDAKKQVIQQLAKWMSNPDSNGLVLGISGVPGIGKTNFCKDGICKALGLPFGLVGLGGISDGSHLVGHSYTYEGSKCGRIAEILINSGVMNPVIFFDELDKISQTQHGEEISNILIHLTDSTMNDRFTDKYFSDVDLDLSKCLIVFSYNDDSNINPILLDRMIKIKTNGYNTKDKLSIAKKHLIPDILKSYGFTSNDIIIDDCCIKYVIDNVDSEQGVRNLKRGFEEIIGKINLNRIVDKNPISFPYTLSPKKVESYLPKTKDLFAPHLTMYV